LKPFLPTASRPGRQQNGGFYFYFFEKTCAESHWQWPSEGGVYFFEKNVPRARGNGRRQRRFFIF
jgi:hypothetical protein